MKNRVRITHNEKRYIVHFLNDKVYSVRIHYFDKHDNFRHRRLYHVAYSDKSPSKHVSEIINQACVIYGARTAKPEHTP